MKRLIISLLVPSSLLLADLSTINSFPSSNYEKSNKLNRIIIENRILTQINDHPISVIDIMKKMDTEFFIQVPHLMDSDIARYQFYRNRWRSEFDNFIDGELILKDAENHKIDLSDGEVRQELEHRFGPEVIVNIDKIGLTYDEAWDIVKKDMLIQRMSQSYLYLKGVFSVAPDDLLKSYREYIQNNKKPDQWKYYMISFSGPNAFEDAQIGKKQLDELVKENKNFKSLCFRFQSLTDQFENKKISISKEFNLASDQIQESHRSILTNLSQNTFSEPVKEMSRSSNTSVYRIFYLSDYKPGGKIELADIEEKLLYQLKQQKFEQEYLGYVNMLRERYGATRETIYEAIPNDFEPFKMK